MTLTIFFKAEVLLLLARKLKRSSNWPAVKPIIKKPLLPSVIKPKNYSTTLPLSY